MRGADIHTVAQLLGHRDLRMAMRYQHLAPGFLAEAVGRLYGVFGETAGMLPGAPDGVTVGWRGPQRGYAARPAYARADLGPHRPKPALRFAGAAPASLPGGVDAPLARLPVPNFAALRADFARGAKRRDPREKHRAAARLPHAGTGRKPPGRTAKNGCATAPAESVVAVT